MCFIYLFIYLFIQIIGLAVRVFANGPGDLGSIPGRVIPKTQKMVLDASLLNTQHYKVRIKGKVVQSWEGVAPPLHLGVVAIEKGAFGSPSTMVANFTLLCKWKWLYLSVFLNFIILPQRQSVKEIYIILSIFTT